MYVTRREAANLAYTDSLAQAGAVVKEQGGPDQIDSLDVALLCDNDHDAEHRWMGEVVRGTAPPGSVALVEGDLKPQSLERIGLDSPGEARIESLENQAIYALTLLVLNRLVWVGGEIATEVQRSLESMPWLGRLACRINPVFRPVSSREKRLRAVEERLNHATSTIARDRRSLVFGHRIDRAKKNGASMVYVIAGSGHYYTNHWSRRPTNLMRWLRQGSYTFQVLERPGKLSDQAYSSAVLTIDENKRAALKRDWRQDPNYLVLGSMKSSDEAIMAALGD